MSCDRAESPGASVSRSGIVEARALHYDNRGDQTVFDGKQYAWLTRFDSYGVRLELGDVHLTLLQAAGINVGTFGDDGRRPIDAMLA